MISEIEKSDILQSILDSPDFKDSKRYGDLLRFLVGKSVSGEHLKESTIAHEFFERDISFDPGKDSFVRSYISGLRKKIEHYYLTLPEPPKNRMSIPKGQYNIHFEVFENVIKTNTEFKFGAKYVYGSVILLALFIIATFFIFQATKPRDLGSPLLNDPFLSNFVGTQSKKTIIALGDFFFFTETTPLPKGRVYIRNSDINNEKDFQNWVKSNADNQGKYEPLNFTYLRPSASIGLLNIINKFKNGSDNFEVKVASSLKWQDFEKNDIIYIGSLKTLYILDTLILKTSFRYNFETKELKIIEKNGNGIKSLKGSPTRAGNYAEDYSAILKIPNSNHNSILILSGVGEVGIMGSIKIAMEDNFCELLKTNFNYKLENPKQHFSLISKIKGVHETIFGYKMESFDLMNPF